MTLYLWVMKIQTSWPVLAMAAALGLWACGDDQGTQTQDAETTSSAEMFGGIQEAFDVTLNYLKERDQFGAKIGSFQALQHRAAIMFSEIELCKSCVLESLTSFDEGSNDIPRLASLAKAKIGEVFHLVSNEAVQMHGGIGVTDEYDIGFYLKRARVAEQIFGNVQFHKDRYAELTGY